MENQENSETMSSAEKAIQRPTTESRRIMILSDGFPPYDRGGGERIAYYHALAMRDLGWDVAVFTAYPPGTNQSSVEEEEPGIRVYRMFPQFALSRSGEGNVLDRFVTLGSSLANPLMRKSLEATIADFQPDVLHAHYIVRISHSAFAQVAPQTPRVITFHGYQYECPKGGLYRKRRAAICEDKPLPCRVFRDLMTSELGSVDRIVAISHFIEARLAEAGHPKEKIRYVPNGVPNLKSRERTPASANRNFLYVGRITANKGLEELISAFRQLDAADAKLIIVGDGEHRPAAEATAGGDPRIEFTGWQTPDQVAEHYKQARAVVVPSLWHEVMNTVICEAQSWSRPVVATRVGGNSDLIQEDQSGFICETGDIDALRNRMQQLWNDDALTDRLGDGGFAHVEQYSMQRHTDGLMRIYTELGV